MCFSRVRPDHPRCRSATWICICDHTRDPVIYSKFHRNPFKGFGTPGGQNLALPITLASRFYNSLYTTVQAVISNASLLLSCDPCKTRLDTSRDAIIAAYGNID